MWRTTKSEPGASRARVVFLTVVSAGLRRGEILGLRWKDVALADPAGATLRVRETFVRGHVDTPKSEKSERTLALGDDEHVFVSQTGGPLDPGRYAATLRLALAKAKVDRPMRPFHDGRHTSITNAAAAGTSSAALQARAGHASFSTTQAYCRRGLLGRKGNGL
jgi:integrase